MRLIGIAERIGERLPAGGDPLLREGRVVGSRGARGRGGPQLRSSFVSLALWEGQSLTRVAEQAGHSVATLANHYAGVIEELEDQPRIPAAEAIRRAREQATGQLSLVAR